VPPKIGIALRNEDDKPTPSRIGRREKSEQLAELALVAIALRAISRATPKQPASTPALVGRATQSDGQQTGAISTQMQHPISHDDLPKKPSAGED
jgi:hypothetical protein